MLNVTKFEFEQPDPDMYLLLEKGMRGSVSYISKGYSNANIKYLKPYDPKQK